MDYELSDPILYFSKYYDLMGDNENIDENYYTCQCVEYCKNGLQLRENKLAPCMTPFALEHVYQMMPKHWDRDMIYLDLTDETIGRGDVISMLHTPMKMCKYCHIDGVSHWKQLNESMCSDICNWSVKKMHRFL